MTDTYKELFEEFETFFNKSFMLPGHKPSQKGTQRIWSTAYSAQELLKSFLRTHMIPRKVVEEKVGMLRQWLNENRIDDPKKMVTNEDILSFLCESETK